MWLGGDEPEGGAEGGEGKVGYDAEPGEEGFGVGVEAGGEELLGEGFVLEVERDVGEVGWDWDVG